MQIRQSAGLLLKNNLKQQYAGSPPAFQEYIKVMSPLRRLRLWSWHPSRPFGIANFDIQHGRKGSPP